MIHYMPADEDIVRVIDTLARSNDFAKATSSFFVFLSYLFLSPKKRMELHLA